MQILQKSLFKRQVKKLKANQKKDLDEAIKEIIKNPFAAERKKGDLSYIYVHKFKMGNQLTLLAYKVSEIESALYLISVGPHENFYRDLKTNLLN